MNQSLRLWENYESKKAGVQLVCLTSNNFHKIIADDDDDGWPKVHKF